MMKLSIIGNLGADARLEAANGGEFVAFNVAHTETIHKADGSKQERTTWVSCTINGKNERLLPYLKKGTKVYAMGDPTFRTFHSEKQRQLVVGVNLFVRSLELVGATPDAVPRALFDTDGLQHNVEKYYWSENKSRKERSLYSSSGAQFIQDYKGFILPVGSEAAEQPAEAAQGEATQANDAPFT